MDFWSVEVIEAMLVEVLVDGNSHVVTDAQDSTEQVGTWTQVSLLAEELHRVSLLLKWVLVGITVTQYLNGSGLDLTLLVTALAGDELTGDLKTCTGSNTLQSSFVKLLDVGYDLDARYA